MPKYLIQGYYTAEYVKGLLKEGGSKRREAVKRALEDVGAKLEAFYFAFGEADVYAIVDAPDNISVTAPRLGSQRHRRCSRQDRGSAHPRRGRPGR